MYHAANGHSRYYSNNFYFIKYPVFLFLLTLLSCTSPTYPPVENPLDAGRQFADAIYKGNFERARQLIVPDAENKTLLQQREDDYHQRSSTIRNDMAQASLQIQNVQNLAKDSTTIIRFVNAYDGKPAELKVVKNNGNWLVDLKHPYK